MSPRGIPGPQRPPFDEPPAPVADQLAALTALVDSLRHEVDGLRRDNAALNARLESGSLASHDTTSDCGSTEPAQLPGKQTSEAEGGQSRWSRRALILGGFGAAAGAAHALAPVMQAAAAAGEPVLQGQENYAPEGHTVLSSSSDSPTLSASNSRGAAFSAGHGLAGTAIEATSGTGTAIRAMTSGGGTAIRATGSESAGVDARSMWGPGLAATSRLGPALRLGASNLATYPTSGQWSLGDVVVTTGGEFWLCVESGSPGQWRMLSGPQAGGAFVPLTPTRVYDSRALQPDYGRILEANTSRLIDVSRARDLRTGAPLAQVIPQGTRAVAVNVTVTGTIGSGFLALAPGVAANFSASAINWTQAGQTIANGLNITLDSSLQVRAFARGGSSHLTIDVMGYFAQA